MVADTKTPPLGFSVQPDDTFLISYPKSGNTWVRFLFAHVLGPEGAHVDFHSVERIVPEPELKPQLLSGLGRPRVLKSHSRYRPGFRRVIYIVRDPRDVLISYFEYTRKRLGPGATLDDLLARQEKLAYGSWAAHVRSWYGRAGVRFFRYEALRENTVAVFGEMLRFAGIERTPERIAAAVKACSFACMKHIEESFGRPFASEQARMLATPFMRAGRSGAWRERLTPAQLEQILRVNIREMLLLGYLPDPARPAQTNRP